MGKITTIGADRIALNLETKGKQAKARAREMLDAGAKILIASAKGNIMRYKLVRTGDLLGSIGSTRPRVGADSASIEITSLGERTRGKKKLRTDRNATIGFVQEHGRSYGKTVREARPFFSEAADSSEPRIIELWGRMANDK